MSIKVLSSGLYTSVQDKGRMGYRSLGVPVSGAMDAFSARLANRLLGNPEDNAVLEVMLQGPVLEFTQATRICLTGATFQATLNEEPITLIHEVSVKNGDVLRFGTATSGVFGYMAVTGGIQSEKVLNSRSLYEGVTSRGKITKEDIIPIANTEIQSEKFASVAIRTEDPETNALTVYKGPEFDSLPEDIQAKIETISFSITPDGNRMAYILDSEISLSVPGILTAPVQPGTVQLTPSGKIIVLMRDGQTTGGYARILQLSDKSINRLSQGRAGDEILFSLI